MTDPDDALARAGAAWRAALAAPPDLADAAARVRPRERRHRRWNLTLAASVAVVATVVVVGVVALLRGSGRPSGVPAAVRIGAHSIPYAGTLSFRDAVLDARDPRVLHVFIDKDQLAGNVCYSTRELGIVTRQDSQVWVRVAGYAPKAGPECPGMAWGLTPVTVRLAQPFGQRTLYDATDDRSHPVLDAAAVPQAHRVLAGCAKQSRVLWNEVTGLETRRYDSRTCAVTVQVGRPAVVPHGADGVRRTVAVNGHRAVAWRTVTHVYTTIVVEWRVAPARVVRLRLDRIGGTTATPAEVLAVANSVR